MLQQECFYHIHYVMPVDSQADVKDCMMKKLDRNFDISGWGRVVTVTGQARSRRTTFINSSRAVGGSVDAAMISLSLCQLTLDELFRTAQRLLIIL